MEEEGTQEGFKPAGKLSPDYNSYNLYFKGLIRGETRGILAGFGVAICDHEDNLMFQMKGSFHDSAITALEAELMALKRGLTEAVSLGITHISICCDHYLIFELVMERYASDKDKIALLVHDVQCIRQQLTSSIPFLVNPNQTKFAYKLAMETLVNEISIRMPPLAETKTCGMCFNDDFEAGKMFGIALCGHQFCVECAKRHIQVELSEGRSVLRCPRYGCKSNMTLRSCDHFLTHKLRDMWKQRIKEESNKKTWRQCKKCQHMIELPRGCDNHVFCRCGYSFCYICGTEWKIGGECPHIIKEGCGFTFYVIIFYYVFAIILLSWRD